MKRFISLLLVLVFILSLSACSCDIDWSNFDLTKKNFGLTEETADTASDSDISADISVIPDHSVNTDDIANYTVPENPSVVYNCWAVVPSGDFSAMANEKLLEIAALNAELSAMKDSLSSFSTVDLISADTGFSKVLNNIRAWSFGARNYPTDGLSDNDLLILEALVTIGVDSSEFGARFPALIITEDTETIGTYEDMIISNIVALSADIMNG